MLRAIDILMKEIDVTLTLLGRPDINALDRSALRPTLQALQWMELSRA